MVSSKHFLKEKSCEKAHFKLQNLQKQKNSTSRMFDANKVLCTMSVFIGRSLAQNNYFNAINVSIIQE